MSILCSFCNRMSAKKTRFHLQSDELTDVQQDPNHVRDEAAADVVPETGSGVGRGQLPTPTSGLRFKAVVDDVRLD